MSNVTIRELPPVVIPIDVADTFLEVSVLEAGVEVSRRVAADALQAAIGLDASFITVGLNAALPNERVLTGSANISITDNGAGSTVVLDVIGSALEPEQLFESGTVVVSTRAQGDVALRADVVGTTPPLPADNPLAILDFYNITEVNRLGRVGFNGIGGNLLLSSEVHGGDIVLSVEDAAGVPIIGLQIDPDAITTLRGDTTVNIVAEGEAVPFAIFGNDAGSGSPVRRLVLRDFDTDGVMNYGIEFQEADFTPTGFIGYGFGILTQLQVANRFNDGQLRISITDGAGIARSVMLAVPASNLVSLFDGSQNNPNVNIVTFANGSLEIRNEVTGPNSPERAMTGADRAALIEEWEFDSSTDTSTDPGTNDFRMNNVDPSLVTEIAVDDLMLSQIGDFGDFFGPELVAGDRIFIKQKNDGTRWASYILSGPPVDATGFWQIPVTVDDQGVIFTNFQECSFDFTSMVAGSPISAGVLQGDTLFWDTTALAYLSTSNLSWDEVAATRGLTLQADLLTVGNLITIDLGGGSGDGIVFDNPANSPYTFLRLLDPASANGFSMVMDPTLSAANHRLNIDSDLSGTLLQLEADGVIRFLPFVGTPFEIQSVGGVERIFVQNGGTLYFEELAAAQASILTHGQLWVRNDAPNTLVFTDDVGTDFPIGGALASNLFTGNPGIIISNAAAHIGIRETGGTADEGNWILRADGDLFRISTATDAAPNTPVEDVISVVRSAAVIDQIDMGAPVTADSNFLLEGYTTGKSVLRSIRFIAAPGATPNTNMDLTNNNTDRSYNAPSITDANDLAASGSSGSWSLDATGQILTLDITEDIVGILGIDASIVVDINSSTQTEMYFVDPRISGANVTFFIFRRGTSAALSWLDILDAGDQWHIQFQFVTSS